MKKTRFLVLLIALLVGGSASVQAQLKLLSGLKGGTYEQLANDIKSAATQEVSVLTSKGSVDNFNQLVEDNDIFVAFMQYDVLLTNELQNPELRKNLRVLMRLFLDEEIHIVSKKGSKITELKDLRGKKVAVGVIGQGTYVTAHTIKQTTHTAWIDVAMSSNDAVKALEKDEIDAFFYVGGAPVKSLTKLGKKAKLQLVNINNPALDGIYKKKKIEKGTYPWQTSNVSTYAVPTLLVCNVKNISKDTQRKLNKMLKDTKNGLSGFQTKGHEKWKSVYTKTQIIDWPYYYPKPVVDL